MDYKKRTSDSDVLIAEGAVVVGDVTLAKGVSVWYNAVIRGDEAPIEVGENTNIQDGAILHARAVVGSNCTVGHCAIVHGCTGGNHTLIGMGAILLDGAKIGDHCIVGAGALVTGKLDAPAGSMVLGSPAKVVRPLTQAEMDSVDASVQEYLEFAQGYRASHE
mgnify:FL=1